MWKEIREHARQHEAQRSIATNMVLLLTSASVGLMVTVKFGYRTVPLAVAIILLGAFGFLLSAKHYERSQRSTALAVEFERRLDEMDEALQIAATRRAGESINESAHPLLFKIRLNKLWSALHVLVFLVGVTTLVMSLVAE
ncbi:hypothetical protein AB0F81_15600 [Actinoplanes sp. NPDC024001]|uniref:hypothetical protein n=1 Tax=Actinoplanes sp. NPDC024001 TaxID=3154598 RepID=UPI0034102B70